MMKILLFIHSFTFWLRSVQTENSLSFIKGPSLLHCAALMPSVAVSHVSPLIPCLRFQHPGQSLTLRAACSSPPPASDPLWDPPVDLLLCNEGSIQRLDPRHDVTFGAYEDRAVKPRTRSSARVGLMYWNVSITSREARGAAVRSVSGSSDRTGPHRSTHLPGREDVMMSAAAGDGALVPGLVTSPRTVSLVKSHQAEMFPLQAGNQLLCYGMKEQLDPDWRRGWSCFKAAEEEAEEEEEERWPWRWRRRRRWRRWRSPLWSDAYIYILFILLLM